MPTWCGTEAEVHWTVSVFHSMEQDELLDRASYWCGQEWTIPPIPYYGMGWIAGQGYRCGHEWSPSDSPTYSVVRTVEWDRLLATGVDKSGVHWKYELWNGTEWWIGLLMWT